MKTRKISALFLMLTLMLAFSITTYANNTQTFTSATRLVTNAVNTPSYHWGLGDSYFLGESIPTYTLRQGDLTLCTDTSFSPVFQGSRIAGILTGIRNGTNNVSHTFSKSFAEKLNAATQSGQKNAILILNARQVFVYCDGKATELAFYDIPLTSGDSDTSAATVAAAASRLPAILTSDPDYNRNTRQLLSIKNLGTRGSEDLFKVLNVEIWQQPTNSNQCWAATTWCIGEYMNKDSSLKFANPRELAKACNYTGNEGQTLSQLIEHIKNQYGVVLNEPTYTINESKFESEIDKSKPFAMCWWHDNDPNQMAHMGTACGYSKSNDVIEEIGVMDSLEGDILWIEKGNDGYYTQKMGNFTYTWRTNATQK